jgi:hypothetical protein
LYDLTGGLGRFQFFVCLTYLLSLTGPHLLMSNIVFYEMVPSKFYCVFEGNKELKVECSKDYICINNQGLISWEGDKASMKNFVEDFNLICENKFSIGLIGSMYFFGEAMGSLLYMIFSVKYQETRVSHVKFKNFGALFILTVLTFFARDLLSLYQLMFCAGFI